MDIYRTLFEFVIEAQASARLYVGPGVDYRQLHEQCLPLLKRHVAIELLCAEASVAEVMKDAVALSLFHQFKKLGGSVYHDFIFCEVDFKKSLAISLDDNGAYAIQYPVHSSDATSWMDRVTATQQEILVQQGDIFLWGEVDQSAMFHTQQAGFKWEASNADYLELKPVELTELIKGSEYENFYDFVNSYRVILIVVVE